LDLLLRQKKYNGTDSKLVTIEKKVGYEIAWDDFRSKDEGEK
jgi:hypothetical protein